MIFEIIYLWTTEGEAILSPEHFPLSINVFHSLFGVFHALSTVAFSLLLSLLYQSVQSAL